MTNVVWMRLTAINVTGEETEHFMFGPTGVTQFKDNGTGQTYLFNSKGELMKTVKESQDVIFDLIAEVRGFSRDDGDLNEQNV
jgi:hypothetical protein